MGSGERTHVGGLETMILELFAEPAGIGDPIHEQHAGEVIHFVLDAACHQSVGLHGAGATHLIPETHLHRTGPHHIEIHPWDAQAALLVGVETCARRHDLRIDQHQRRCAGGLGIEVNDQTIGIQVMKDVCMGGPGHYLGHDQTIGLMQTEYIYPELSDRSSPKEWEELGKPNLVAEAVKRKNQILSEFVPQHIPEELDARIRADYDIRLG